MDLTDKICILEYDKAELLPLLKNQNIIDKDYRLTQICDGIYKSGFIRFADMTSLSLSLRNALADKCVLLQLHEEKRFPSADGTIKFLFELSDAQFIEAVYLKDKNNRVTFCISSQVGCRMGCTFCKTGKMGLIRSLTVGEIVSQILYLWHCMHEDESVSDKFFNVVFMGMGEPLDNADNVSKAIQRLTARDGLAMSASRITISTSGLVDKIEPFLAAQPNLNFAVSLNAASQQKRVSVMPVAKKHTIAQIKQTLDALSQKYKKRFTLEYVMIAGFNIGFADAQQLKIWSPKHYLINVIPLNHSDEQQRRPREAEIKKFCQMLQSGGLNVTRRYRRGADIAADCGQLFLDRLAQTGAAGTVADTPNSV